MKLRKRLPLLGSAAVIVTVVAVVVTIYAVGVSRASSQFKLTNIGDEVVVEDARGNSRTFSVESNSDISKGSTIIDVAITDQESNMGGRLLIDEWDRKIRITAGSADVTVNLKRRYQVEVEGTTYDGRFGRSQIADAIAKQLDGVPAAGAAAMLAAVQNDLNSGNIANGDEILETIEKVVAALDQG